MSPPCQSTPVMLYEYSPSELIFTMKRYLILSPAKSGTSIISDSNSYPYRSASPASVLYSAAVLLLLLTRAQRYATASLVSNQSRVNIWSIVPDSKSLIKDVPPRQGAPSCLLRVSSRVGVQVRMP